MNIDPEKYPKLSKACLPKDLRLLDVEELTELCDEVRDFLLNSVSKSSGHLASGLGVVELTVALHYVFNTPIDQIIWDVGHQAYPHKILTGRASVLDTIRKYNGLHPFPWRQESVYDPVSVGHASTSIGMALGLSIANKIQDIDNKVVAVIGDGSLTGGMAYEAMNHAGGLGADMLVILNDNENSISSTVGAISTTLSRIISSSFYTGISNKANSFLKNFPTIKNFANRTTEHIKGLVMPGTMFEELGFNYIGPINGHDVKGLVEILEKVKNLKGPQFLHIVSQKGHGYEPAESNPTKYHGVPCFELNKNIPDDDKETYSSVFGDFMVDQAELDPRLTVITPAMKEGSGLNKFAELYKDRFFDVAIAEQHAITLAGGMAINGLHPVTCIYSSFLQRSYDQLIHDIAIQEVPIMVTIDRAGIVGADGPTHQGIFDIAYLRTIPNFVVMVPSSFRELREMLALGSRFEYSTAIRYPRGGELSDLSNLPYEPIELGKGLVVRKGKDIVIFNFGALLDFALKAADKLNATVCDMRFVKPLDEQLIIAESVRAGKLAVTVEDGVISGGAGSGVLKVLSENCCMVPVLNIGIPDCFVEQGRPSELYTKYKMDDEGIVAQVEKFISEHDLK